MVPNHATQTDPYLHEPKGISTAAAGTVYVANGAGSGSWTTYGTGAAFSNSTTTGLSYTVTGGFIRSAASITTVAGTTLTLTDATTNYVYVDLNTLAITSNTTGFLPHHVPLYTVTTTAGAVVTNTDNRGMVVNAAPSTYRTATFATDANKTLTAFEYSNAVVKLAGTISTTRNAVVPLTIFPTVFYNATTASVQVIGASGTGVTIATTKKAQVFGDGTNIVRLTADI